MKEPIEWRNLTKTSYSEIRKIIVSGVESEKQLQKGDANMYK